MAPTTSPTISLQAQPKDAASWAALARRAEDAGFDALLAADHPGAVASPYVALAAAAAVTSRLGLGAYVSHAGIREPLLLASDVATLDVVSGGRARLALGAGHTPAEWEMLGSSRPDVAGRVRRFLAVAEATRTLLAGGEVTLDGPEVHARKARLDGPRPVQDQVPFVFGGGNSALLRWAGEHADAVALSGLGRTLPDGHKHSTRIAETDVDEQLALVAEGAERAADREAPPELEALVHFVELTDDAEAAAAELAGRLDCTAEVLLASPYAWIGTEAEIRAKIERDRSRWGITRYVVREPGFEVAERMLG
ncbi:LLM class flavin-dependent oxidoreductase [Streptomyces boninensis]|uniref:LLM class flavin-dependent oxidoreductase n=1 Tax=Streptomyces boninensis TaxID=2039455 RepID=UPI003B2267A2